MNLTLLSWLSYMIGWSMTTHYNARPNRPLMDNKLSPWGVWQPLPVPFSRVAVLCTAGVDPMPHNSLLCCENDSEAATPPKLVRGEAEMRPTRSSSSNQEIFLL